MTLHIQELEQIGIGEPDNMMFGDGKGGFSSHILNTDSSELAEIKRMAKKYGICPLAFLGCYGPRDPEIIERVCSRAPASKSCSNFKNRFPITKAEYESRNYVVEFTEPITKDFVALSGV